MKLKKILIILIIALVIAASVYYFGIKLIPSGNVVSQPSSSNFGAGQKVLVTKENFYEFVQGNEIVQSMPKEGVLLLRLYNYNTGERQWEKNYIITKGMIVEGYSEDVDAVLILASKYAPYLAQDFCGTMKKANEAGDLRLEMKKGQAGLMWKYRGMMKYKSCLGI